MSGTHRSHWWGCGRQDHMERGLWLRSPKLVTRLLPSPWAECEMRLARPNVLHMHHLCHKTNLINVNYVAAIIRRGAASQTRTATCVRILAQGWDVHVREDVSPTRPSQLHKPDRDSSSKKKTALIHKSLGNLKCGEDLQKDTVQWVGCQVRVCYCARVRSPETSHTVCLTRVFYTRMCERPYLLRHMAVPH